MTKIDGISEGSQISTNKPLQKTDAELFKKTLDKAIETKESVQTEKTTKSNLPEIQSAQMVPAGNTARAFENKTGQLLDLMDRFAGEMGNPERTLKEIEPLVVALRENAEALLKSAEKEAAQDSPVREIAVESAMRANIEYIKFYRGDYV